MQYYGKTDIGQKRKTNQDSYVAEILSDGTLLCVVCDGMGGANGGNIASFRAISVFTDYIKENLLKLNSITTEELLKSAINSANRDLLEVAKNDESLSGMGTTLVCAIIKEDYIYIANIGDSRLYVMYDDKNLDQLTRDHSFVQDLIDNGQITEEQAANHPNKNIITRAIGVDNEVVPDIFKISSDIKAILLCSDGLSGYVSKDEISSIICKFSPEDAVNKLIESANNAGGKDNITAIAVKF